MKPPLLSVILTTFNYARYLPGCIKSVLSQSFGDFELIVVDDGSTDHTPEIIRQFHDSRLIYIRHERNLGPSMAKNTGIKRAKGRYLGFIGADDLRKEENLEMKVGILERNPEVGLVHSNVEMIDREGRVLYTKYEVDSQVAVHQRQPFEKLLKGNFITASTVVIRRECIDYVGFFDSELRHSEDWDMWLRIAYFYDFIYVARPLVQYRIHQWSLSQRNIRADWDLIALERIFRRLFHSFRLEERGYDFKEVFWPNYFREVNGKLGKISTEHFLRLYLRGLKSYPKFLLRSQNFRYLTHFLLSLIFPPEIQGYLKKERKRVMK